MERAAMRAREQRQARFIPSDSSSNDVYVVMPDRFVEKPLGVRSIEHCIVVVIGAKLERKEEKKEKREAPNILRTRQKNKTTPTNAQYTARGMEVENSQPTGSSIDPFSLPIIPIAGGSTSMSCAVTVHGGERRAFINLHESPKNDAVETV